jgi:hypothetical protein
MAQSCAPSSQLWKRFSLTYGGTQYVAAVLASRRSRRDSTYKTWWWLVVVVVVVVVVVFVVVVVGCNGFVGRWGEGQGTCGTGRACVKESAWGHKQAVCLAPTTPHQSRQPRTLTNQEGTAR